MASSLMTTACIDIVVKSKMNLTLTSFLLKVCLLLIAINAPFGAGSRHKKPKLYEYESENDDFGDDDDASMEESLQPPQIDFHGSVRKGMAMQVGLIDPNRNSVCSPISALLPLGKLAVGAKGKTEKELLDALGYSSEEPLVVHCWTWASHKKIISYEDVAVLATLGRRVGERSLLASGASDAAARRKYFEAGKGQLKPNLKRLIKSMRNIEGITLDVVSKIYVSKSARIHPTFEEHSKEIFGSSLDRVNLLNPQNAVDTINDFVSKQTRNMIQNLLSPNDIGRGASLILVNAIYFQGNWRKRFNKAVPSTFYSTDGLQTVPMMEVVDTFKYVKAESISAEIIEIPYMNSNASFVVVLPDERNGLPMLLTALKLAPAILNEAMKEMKLTSVKVLLPKFKVSTKLNLKDLFKKVGVARLFQSNHRDLDSILLDQSVFVSSATQKALIEVSELGTEAAAASATKVFLSLPHHRKTFKADHPFLFFVLANNQQLFSGIFTSLK